MGRFGMDTDPVASQVRGGQRRIVRRSGRRLRRASIFVMVGCAAIAGSGAGMAGRTDTPGSAELTASNGAVADGFGWSVAVSGNTIVVGAPGNPSRGQAYVFVRPRSGWSGRLTQTARVSGSDGGGMDLFGLSVAVSGNTIVVGAPNHVRGGGVAGEAYVFVRPKIGVSGKRTEAAVLTASSLNNVYSDDFGASVAVSGNTIVVGAPNHDVGNSVHQGEA